MLLGLLAVRDICRRLCDFSMSGYECSKCSRCYHVGSHIIKHVQIAHGEPDFTYDCKLGECSPSGRQFTVFESFRKHMKRKHAKKGCAEPENGRNLLTSEASGAASIDVAELHAGEDVAVRYEDLQHLLKKRVTVCLLQLSEQHAVPSVARRMVALQMKSIFETFHAHHTSLIRSCLNRIGVNPDDDSELERLLSSEQTAIGLFEDTISDYRFFKYCCDKLHLVQPVQYKLHHSGCSDEVIQYVPLLKLLEKALSLNAELATPAVSDLANDRLEDFSYGEICKRHRLFSSNRSALRLHFYTDEFEVVNPLGSKKTRHKMCAFYFTIGNTDQHLRSKCKYIFLSLLCRYNAVRKFGYAEVLAPLLADLKKLEKGVTLHFNASDNFVQGAVATISMDNLSAHSLAGFSKSFSSGYICRFCMATSADLPQNDESKLVLRTAVTHASHVDTVEKNPGNVPVYGVTGKCAFDILSHFEVMESCPPDIMHDFLEGTLPLVMTLVIKTLVAERCFTLENLHFIMETFPYG